MDSKELRGLVEAYSEVYAPQQIDEADSLAAMQARREKRQKANMKKHGTPGFDYSKPPSGKTGYLDTLKKEEFDIFDVVLEFLQAEGYAETLEEAEWMMANMIDEEAIDIILGEGYQRNPEKGEKEDKKYAPVRGEKPPMPPRGDKRREDFEKWYAKQMGR